jgi:polysaccharide chain length determinant protein (PEP-CTERM system associated)
MREQFEQLKMHLWMVLHHRWVTLGGAVLVCALGWAGLETVKDRYQVDAKVYLDTKAALQPLFQGPNGAQTWSPQQSALLIKRTLLNRENIERVIEETDLKAKIKKPEDLDTMVMGLAESIKVKRLMPAVDEEANSRNDTPADIYSISFEHTNRELALKIVQSVLDLFVERFSYLTETSTKEAAAFLDKEIAAYARNLGEAEERLKQFKLDNPGVLLGENGQTYSQRVEALQSELESAKISLREAEFRAAALRVQIQNMAAARVPVSVGGAAAGQSALDSQIAAAEARLSELLLNYTEQHPDIIGLRRQLAEMKEQKKKGLDVPAGGGAPVVYAPATDTSGARLLLTEAEARAAAMKEQIALKERQLLDLKPLAETVPKVEAELARLNRDYEVIKATYAELVQRRETISLSAGAQSAGGDSMFKVIEAPRLPLVPVGPQRQLLTTAIFLAALALGAGLGWMRAQSRPTFYTRNQLATISGAPVLGAITMNWNVMEVARRQFAMLLFGIVVLALLAAYVGVLIHNGYDINPMIKTIVEPFRMIQA